MTSSNLNVNNFQSVNYKTKRVYSNVKGYGNIVKCEVADSVVCTHQPYNRLENLKTPFGVHLPENAEKNYILSNPQTKIAWK
jgi:hypothetical protein